MSAFGPQWSATNPGHCVECGATDRPLIHPVWKCAPCIKAQPSTRCTICAAHGVGADGLCDVCRYTWGTAENREAAHRENVARYEEERAFQEAQREVEPCEF